MALTLPAFSVLSAMMACRYPAINLFSCQKAINLLRWYRLSFHSFILCAATALVIRPPWRMKSYVGPASHSFLQSSQEWWKSMNKVWLVTMVLPSRYSAINCGEKHACMLLASHSAVTMKYYVHPPSQHIQSLSVPLTAEQRGNSGLPPRTRVSCGGIDRAV